MCGIAGIVSLDGERIDPAPVDAMLAALVHRGPDSFGSYGGAGVRAGIRRLRVIDLQTGDQPIANEDGTVEVVFNGEIYNHGALRDELRGRGHAMRSASDTEVLVHLWEDEGPALLDRLNGMFAFCLHDRRTGEVFVARDRMGIKPLYFADDGRRIVFASEPRAVEAGLGSPRPADPDRLLDLFFLQYVPGADTVFTGIRKLLPGHVLHVKDGRSAIRRWYDPPGADTGERANADEEAVRLRALLTDAVRLQRVADVPVGAFLSGGLDSTIVASLLAAEGGPLETFSVGFEEASHDERSWARRVSAGLGSQHHEIVLRAEEVGRHLPELVRRLGEPVADPALIPTWLLSRFARERVTVALTGEGADELFGGYRRHAYQSRLAWLRFVPGLAAAARTGASGALLPRRAAQALEALGTANPTLNHLVWSATISPSLAAELFGTEAVSGWLSGAAERFGRYFTTGGSLGSRLRADLGEWLPHNLLAKVDRASMAFSLEARVPYLDHRIVERALAMPDELKCRGGRTKLVLRRAFEDIVPPEVMERSKRGFDLPLDAWMRGPLRDAARERLEGDSLARWPLLRPGAAAELFRRHVDRQAQVGLPLFLLYSIAEFLDSHG